MIVYGFCRPREKQTSYSTILLSDCLQLVKSDFEESALRNNPIFSTTVNPSSIPKALFFNSASNTVRISNNWGNDIASALVSIL